MHKASVSTPLPDKRGWTGRRSGVTWPPGVQAPVYGPRAPQGSLLNRFTAYLQARLDQYPGLSGARLLREIQAQGYTGGYTILTDYLRTIRPPQEAGYEVRFETPAGHQGQVDFAHFKVRFRYDPQVVWVVWLFSLALGHSRYLFGRFVWRQTLLALAAHYGFQPRACRPYRAKTQGEQGGAAVSLCPSGLLPGRIVRRPGEFEPAV